MPADNPHKNERPSRHDHSDAADIDARQERHLPPVPWHVAQQKQEGVNKAGAHVVQRILHKGKTTSSGTYVNAVQLGKYSRDEVRKYINAAKHYRYDKATDSMVEIFEKPKGIKKAKTASTALPGDFTGWMAEVNKGVEAYGKKGTTRISYKAREIKDAGKGGFNVGINNIASIDNLVTTNTINNMTPNQKKLNFFANHLMRSIVEDRGELADDEKDDKKTADEKKEKRKKRKLDLGPEIQQIVGSKDKDLHAYIGSNTQKGQQMLKKELFGPPNKKRKIGEYHKAEYRQKTVEEAVKQLKNFLSSHPRIEIELKDLITQKKSDDEIKHMLKSKIGDQYKTKRLKYLYTLRNSLKATYGSQKLEDAMITIPDNDKEIHAESNLVEQLIDSLNVLDVIGTKVPCVACFAKFCQEKKQAHLLQYTSLIWFSRPCMNQLGCDYNKQNADEVLLYLNKIDNNLKDMVGKIKMYTGTMGDIKQEYMDEDSDSMGEESRQSILDEYK